MRSKSITFTFAGHTLSIPAWSRLLGIPASTLYHRYRRHPDWSPADILGAEDFDHWRGHLTVIFAHEYGECHRYWPDLRPCPAHGHPEGEERPCGKCGLVADPWPDDQPMMSPDPCLGWLPGVRFACCGHGAEDGNPYVSLETGDILDDQDALDYFAIHAPHGSLHRR
jgi:hypothetical protein